MGDGASNQGTFLESLNLAAVWNLPVIFVIENNGYAESTSANMPRRVDSYVDRAAGFGMPGVTVDGTDFFAVYEAAGEIIGRAREGGGPALLECKMIRFYGHFEGDAQTYAARRNRRHPLEQGLPEEIRAHGDQAGVITRAELDAIDGEVLALIDDAVAGREGGALPRRATCSPTSTSSTDSPTEPRDVHGPQISMKMAINEALDQEMTPRPDRDRDGRGHRRRTGRRGERTPGAACSASPRGSTPSIGDRLLDTPLSESAYIGAAIGAAACGMRPVAELMFIDFMGVCFDQIFNQAAKFRYMFGGKAETPVVIRAMVRRGLPRGRAALPDADAALHAHSRAEGGVPVERL